MGDFILKSRPCRDFLRLMDMDEDANYTRNLDAVIEMWAKRWFKLDREKLEKEIDLYM